jgi:hypothetical protein
MLSTVLYLNEVKILNENSYKLIVTNTLFIKFVLEILTNT